MGRGSLMALLPYPAKADCACDGTYSPPWSCFYAFSLLRWRTVANGEGYKGFERFEGLRGKKGREV